MNEETGLSEEYQLGYAAAMQIVAKVAAQRDELAAALRMHDTYQTDMEKAGFGAYSETEMCAATDAALAKVQS